MIGASEDILMHSQQPCTSSSQTERDDKGGSGRAVCSKVSRQWSTFHNLPVTRFFCVASAKFELNGSAAL